MNRRHRRSVSSGLEHGREAVFNHPTRRQTSFYSSGYFPEAYFREKSMPV